MNKILTRTALAAVLLLACLILWGCDDTALQLRIQGCMARHGATDFDKETWRQRCADHAEL